MAESTANTLASDSEIESALAEVESAPDLVPDLDDSFVAVPVDLGLGHGSPLPAPDVAAESTEQDASPRARLATKASASARPFGLFDNLCWLLDRLLAAIDWPFRWLPPGAKQIVGLAAAASILVSIAANAVFPLLWPEPDPIADLRQLRIEAQVRQSAPDAGDSGSSGHAAPPPAKGH
ncbi:MAG: hypothetical protein IPM13_07485 [Phycisphaerales bacterium]|nr:hypothetical protein [Phycisphaerales bacterium]